VRYGTTSPRRARKPRKAPGMSTDVEVVDGATGSWAFVKGSYELVSGRSIADRRVTATITV
jgi:hypothetical protein